MNYLSHFVFNHDICGLPADPYFAMGVALPDLWLRYSRRKRIRWEAVRQARPRDPIDAGLQAGLLNHVAADRRFHVLPTFLRWQRQLKQSTSADGTHPVLLDFLAHVAIELAMDHLLLADDPRLADRFYDLVGQCDPQTVAGRVSVIGGIDAVGLDAVVASFYERRFMRRYRTRDGLLETVNIMLSLAQFPAPHESLIRGLLDGAVELTVPATIWREMHA